MSDKTILNGLVFSNIFLFLFMFHNYLYINRDIDCLSERTVDMYREFTCFEKSIKDHLSELEKVLEDRVKLVAWASEQAREKELQEAYDTFANLDSKRQEYIQNKILEFSERLYRNNVP